MFKQMESKKNKIMLVTVICAILIISVFCINFLLLQPSRKERLGNTTGNIANFGIMVKNDDKIYYTTYRKIMVMDVNGTNQKEVCSGNYSNLSSYGDYIYFTDVDTRLYKIKAGENTATPINPKKKYYNYIIFNDWIYYTDDFTGNLYKTDINCI